MTGAMLLCLLAGVQSCLQTNPIDAPMQQCQMCSECNFASAGLLPEETLSAVVFRLPTVCNPQREKLWRHDHQFCSNPWPQAIRIQHIRHVSRFVLKCTSDIFSDMYYWGAGYPDRAAERPLHHPGLHAAQPPSRSCEPAQGQISSLALFHNAFVLISVILFPRF